MKKLAFVFVTALFGTALSLQADWATGPARPAGATAAFVSTSRPARPAPKPYAAENATIQTFCLECHNQFDLKGELSLDTFDVAKAADHPEVAEKMVRKLRAGMMPPKTAAQPDRAARMALVTALETTLDAASATPNPGHRSFQRLNRAEYSAAVKALLGVEFDVSAYLPADTISASFDNIADVQMPSATVMQGYLRAAAYVSRAAVGDPSTDPGSTTYDVPRTQSQKDRVDGAPFGTRGGTVVVAQFSRRRQLQVSAAPARRADRRALRAHGRQDSDGSGDRRRAGRAREHRSLDVRVRSRRT